MKLTLRLLVLLGYIIHISAAVLQFEEILVHPGIIGGIFKGPNSETIIQGPDGSAITAEQIGGAVETPDVLPSGALAETDVNSIPVSSTTRPELLVTPTLPSVAIGRAEISSTATPIGFPLVASAQPILISNKPVHISSSGIEISTLSPPIVSTAASPIQPSSQPLILSSDVGKGSPLYGPGFFTASEPARVLLPPTSPAPSSAASVDVYGRQPISSYQEIHLRPGPINSFVPITGPPGDLRLSTGYASNVLRGSTPIGSTTQSQSELRLQSGQNDGISSVPVVQPEASIGVLQQQVTSTFSPVSLVQNTEISQKSNIQRIPSSRPPSSLSTVAVNDARQVYQSNLSQAPSLNTLPPPVTSYGQQFTKTLNLQNFETPEAVPLNTRQNIFNPGNIIISPSEAPGIISSTVTPLAKSSWLTNESGKNQILLSTQQNFNVESKQPGRAILISSGADDIRQLNEAQTTPRNSLIVSTARPDATVLSKIEPLDNQVLSYPANATPEIAIPRAPGLVSSTVAPTVGSKEQKLELSPLPNNEGVVGTYKIGQSGRPQQILLEPLPEGAIELGATVSSQTTVTDRLGDVAPKTLGQQVSTQGQYEVYQTQVENGGLLRNTNPFAYPANQNRPGPIPIDSRPLTFDNIPQNGGNGGVVLPPRNFDDSSASILWNRYERSSERTT